jgi:hypothetical protein
LHLGERGVDERCEIALHVGASSDLDVQPERREPGLCGPLACDKPALRVRFLDENGGDVGILAEAFGAQASREFSNLLTQFRPGLGSDVTYCNHWHGSLLCWRAGEGWSPPAETPMPLVTLHAPCGVRAAAIRELDNANIRWREAFVGGSCAALIAATNAGLGVAPMGRVAAGGAVDVGPACGLPRLPTSEIVLFARATSRPVASAIRGLAAAIRSNQR